MKKIPVLFSLFILAASSAHAAPAYGPHMPQRNRVHLGFQSYSVFERELAGTNGEISSQQEFMLVSYGITDWLSLDVKGGAGNIDYEPELGQSVKYSTFVGGGYGFRLKWLDTEKTDGVFGFQHISIHPRTQHIEGVKYKAVQDDWQWSLLVGRDLGTIEPYAGARYSRMDYIRWIDNNRKRVKSELDQSTGAILGFNYFLKENIWLNVEGSALDGEALAASINWHY